ncbi:peptidoglycan-binding domain-containing protein [Frateuria defendens]|uniref:peptidoglycan-binding domain-containing protein n=1 Tax=Frateuria defendens TaxID=2219559 RepID=UPI00066FF670|nr:peptidoglycan-binding domain-containing protein [Frateuria defendens]
MTHPGAAHSQPARGAPAPGQASGEHVQHPGSLREHDHGAPVQALQARLAALGYAGAHDRRLIADGDFGADTKAAVEAFQRSRHLEPDGIAGAKTLDALRQAEHPQQAPAANLADAAHPGHAMYQQALRGVHGIDAAHGRTPDQLSDNLAASLTLEAHRHGLSRIDHVVLSDDGKRVYAVQGELNSPFKRIADVDVGQSVAKPAAQSGAEWNAPPPGHAAPSHAPQPVPPPQPQPAEPPPVHR